MPARRQYAAAAALVVAAVIGVTALTAPSGNDQAADYCTGLRTYTTALGGFNDPSDTAALDKLIQDASGLAKSSPDSLKADWTLLHGYLEDVRAADGDQAKLQQIGAATGRQASEAGQRIAEHGTRSCGITTA
ncbi:hypothetical protein Kfla_4338 [Kribbella flavida DSM 17836]|uniref:Secreted protein n=1 Tax=Kribbella flavida (strain DSM 17836 / JCM 10339 / NBRC 14399) TaxID=479435 RepID=D2PV91_KRIFD|nr:hypothetical protein [Kribbella flavida]ADB33372.1 hypothetical protein Kfla_4338 [Kribbella flavida DSM 17836]